MEALSEHPANCPYCGEPISLLLDLSAGSQEYIEDCQVCCRPMLVAVTITASGDLSVSLLHEDNAT